MSVTGPRIRYRTPADIRAIPNERWASHGDTAVPGVPGGAFLSAGVAVDREGDEA